jgi:hypothetical protein
MPNPTKATANRDLRERTHKRNKLLFPILAIFGCSFLFLLADYFLHRFPERSIVFESIKAFSLAAIPALIIVVYDHYVTIKEVGAEVTNQIESSMTRVMEQFVSGSAKAGLVAFHNRMDFSKLFEELERDDELLWLDTYCPRHTEFVDQIRPALERGAKLRMLIIDTQCQNAKFRADEIGGLYKAENFIKEIEVFTDRMNSICSNNGSLQSSWKIYTYDDLPCIPMYIITRNGIPYRGYSSFFLTKPSAYFVHFEWAPTPDGVLMSMHEYFEQKFKRAELGKEKVKQFPKSVS